MDLNTGDVDALRIITVFTAVTGVIFAMGKWIRALVRSIRRIGHALDILIGVPGIGDVPPRPGIVARIAKIEAEVQPNHGTSMRDTINRTQETIARVEAVVARVEGSLDQHLMDHMTTPLSSNDVKA